MLYGSYVAIRKCRCIAPVHSNDIGEQISTYSMATALSKSLHEMQGCHFRNTMLGDQLRTYDTNPARCMGNIWLR